MSELGWNNYDTTPFEKNVATRGHDSPLRQP